MRMRTSLSIIALAGSLVAAYGCATAERHASTTPTFDARTTTTYNARTATTNCPTVGSKIVRVHQPMAKISKPRAANRTTEQHASFWSENDPLTLVSWMTGSFVGRVQAEDNQGTWLGVQLEMTRIWPESRDGYWLYAEQTALDSPRKPYRQRVYHFHSQPDQTGRIVADVYMLPKYGWAFTGRNAPAAAFAKLSPANLTLQDGCSLYLTRTPDGAFVGGTQGKECDNHMFGAAYATSVLQVERDMIVSLDCGFDKHGERVWGQAQTGHVFARAPQDFFDNRNGPTISFAPEQE
ncbi:MAG: chromophore lyase CpcT/CpeT [Phycisphaerales bacterium]|nr:chromophore lyase CpcT/CpeT [Phycisphaerales bacterium]